MKLRRDGTSRLVHAALLAALQALMAGWICIRIPGGGYIHPGDAVLYTGTVLFGGPVGAAAAAVGGILADWLAGAPQFMPATAIIRPLMALGMIPVRGRSRVRRLLAMGLCGLGMTAGYFVWEWILYGVAAAASGIVFNLIQAFVSMLLGELLITILQYKIQ